MARFFIDRPVFAWVISIIIMGIGILSILTLPVAQYPQIAPPSVTVRAAYPGASADPIANTVTQVIDAHALPAKLVHLVLINGHFVPPEARADRVLVEGDVLAIWPPIAGG